MSLDHAPDGLGYWIAFAGANHLGGHSQAVDRILEGGGSWVAPRGGGDGRDPCWSPTEARAATKLYHAAGLKVYPWVFSRPERWKKEVELYRAFMDEGADGVIVDAEAAWEIPQSYQVLQEHRAQCLAYMEAIRKALGDAFVADAPWPWEGVHPTFPIAEFSGRGLDGKPTGCGVDAHMPQAYAHENGTPEGRFLARYESEWAVLEGKGGMLENFVLPRWPIFDTYSHVSKITPEDLSLCLTNYRDLRAISLYSLEAMDSEIRKFLQARNFSAPADPSPV